MACPPNAALEGTVGLAARLTATGSRRSCTCFLRRRLLYHIGPPDSNRPGGPGESLAGKPTAPGFMPPPIGAQRAKGGGFSSARVPRPLPHAGLARGWPRAAFLHRSRPHACSLIKRRGADRSPCPLFPAENALRPGGRSSATRRCPAAFPIWRQCFRPDGGATGRRRSQEAAGPCLAPFQKWLSTAPPQQKRRGEQPPCL